MERGAGQRPSFFGQRHHRELLRPATGSLANAGSLPRLTVTFCRVSNFGNTCVPPYLPPSTPKNIDLAESTPALKLASELFQVKALEHRIYSFVNTLHRG